MKSGKYPTRRLLSALVGALAVGAGAGIWACNALTGADRLTTDEGTGASTATSGGGNTTTSHTHSGTAGAGAAAGAGGADAGPDPCIGVTCSGEGTCVVDAGAAECQCTSGFHASGLQCVVDQTCNGVTCGRCAQCQVLQGIAQCVCPPNFVLVGIDCRPSPDPCASITCGPNQQCYSEAHCDPGQAGCADTCDCSNCGTCSANDFIQSGAWVLYCGSDAGPPATVACNTPCPNGGGCIPGSPGICWGGEGCMSGP